MRRSWPQKAVSAARSLPVKTASGDVAVKAAASGYSGKDVTVYVAFDAEGAISGISNVTFLLIEK